MQTNMGNSEPIAIVGIGMLLILRSFGTLSNIAKGVGSLITHLHLRSYGKC